MDKSGPSHKVLMLLFLFVLFFIGLADAENVNRSTEYISPFGNYKGLQATKTLKTGIQATSPGTPANAAQSSVVINGDLNVTQGKVTIDEIFEANGGTFETYPTTNYGGMHWFGINVDPSTLPGSPGAPRVELEVNGDVYANYFRASPGNNDSDRLLYFGVTSDGAWVEMGSSIETAATVTPHDFSDPKTAARFNASPKIVLNYYSGGNVGIGTTSPLHKLQIGDPGTTLYAIAYSWDLFSSREFKKDITPFTDQDTQAIFSKIDQLNVVRFHYKEDNPNDRMRIGVLAEEAPEELITADRKSLSMMDTIGFLISGIKALNAENQTLEKEIMALERQIGALEIEKKSL